jgi:hypothetical protein
MLSAKYLRFKNRHNLVGVFKKPKMCGSWMGMEGSKEEGMFDGSVAEG